MADRTPRKRNLLADRCAVFEANQNTDSQSGSFLTNLVRGKTTIKHVDDATQATVDTSEYSFTTTGSGSTSASIRNGTVVATMDVIGEDSIMFEHLWPPVDIARKRSSLMSRMNVSDVTFDTVLPQVSSSNLSQNSFEFIHHPLMEVLAQDGILVSPSKRRSALIANRAAMFEGCNSPPSGFLFAQRKPSPERVKNNNLAAAPNNLEQLQIGIASIKLSNQEESSPLTKDTAVDVEQIVDGETSQPRRRASQKKESTVTVAGEKTDLTPRRLTSSKRVISSRHVSGSEKISKPRRHKSLERRTVHKSETKSNDASPHKAKISSSPRRKSLSHINDKRRSEAVPSPVQMSEEEPRYTIHACIVTKSSPGMKSPQERNAMLKRLLLIKRNKPVV